MVTVATLVTWLSPYTSLARRIPVLRRTRLRQRMATALVFALLPTALFWWWYATAVVERFPDQTSTLRWAIPLAGLWVTIGPLLIQQGEFKLEAVVADFARHGHEHGWDLAAIQRRINLLDRLYRPFVIPVGLAPALALALSFRSLDAVIPVASVTNRVAGLVVIGAVGFSSASGVWGLAKTLALVHAATTTARVQWRAFRQQRIWGLPQLYSFAWTEGLIFSCGAVFVPAMLAVQPQLTTASSLIVWVFVVLLLLGGITVFSIPVLLIHQLAHTGKQRELDNLGSTIESLIITLVSRPESARSTGPDFVRLLATLRLRREIEAVDASPFAFGLLGRAISTLILPVLLTVAQILGSR